MTELRIASLLVAVVAGAYAALMLIDSQTVNSPIGSIASLKVRVKVNGEFNGDLYAYLNRTSG